MEKIGGITLELRRPPFSSYAGRATPFDRKDPNNRLLEAIFGAKSDMDSMEKQHRELQQQRALADLDPELAIEIAVFDSYDIAGIVLDYRLDPPPVLRLVESTRESAARWVQIAPTFDEFAAMVGLNVNGPLYWLPYDQNSTLGATGPKGGTIKFDHQHPLGARLTVEVGSERNSAITSSLHGEPFHTRRLSGHSLSDLTAPMKRAMVEMAMADDPETLMDLFADRFGDQPLLS